MKAEVNLIEFKIAKLTFIGEDKERYEKELERYHKKEIKCRPSKFWICRCECGCVKSIRSKNIKNGNVVSCGCLNRHKAKQRMKDKAKVNTYFMFPNDVVIGKDTSFEHSFEVDYTSYLKIKNMCWNMTKKGYWYARSRESPHKMVQLHRYILGMSYFDNYHYVDHIDRNPSNNKLSNLRIVNARINNQNRKKSKNNTSGKQGEQG